MSSNSAQHEPDNSPLNRECVIVVTTAEVYPDPQLPSISAATTSVTTTKKPSTTQYKKPKRFECNPPASPETQVLPPSKRKFFSGVSAITSLDINVLN